jgi:hypothetical protein
MIYLSDPAQRSRLQNDYRELVALWSVVQTRKSIPPTIATAVTIKFAELAKILEMEPPAMPAASTSTGNHHEGRQQQDVPAVQAAATDPQAGEQRHWWMDIPAVQAAATDPMTKEEFARHARTYAMQLLIGALQPDLDRAEAAWENAREQADLAKGKDQRELAKARTDKAKAVVMELRKSITAIRRGDDSKAIEAEIDRLYAMSSVLPPEAVEARLAELRDIIFTEEARNEDFYPTPDDIIKRHILPAAGLEEFDRVLEPSAGRGNIAEAVRQACPTCSIDVVEINSVRRDYLAMLGYNIVGTDFWEYGVVGKDDRGRPMLDEFIRGRYDRIIMNPPFAKGIGYAHVKRAYDLLAPGGRLVAIIPEGYLFGTSRENVAFQEWARRAGAEPFVLVDRDEYNAHHDRKILINIGVLTIAKSVAAATSVQASAAVDADAASTSESAEERLKRHYGGSQATVTRRDDVDETFVEPEIITAQAHLAKKASMDFVPSALKLPFVKSHVIDGANLAIEALTNRGGFLLADGTGTGKTMQSLIVAQHFFRTLNQPVLIFTVDERVLETSFGDDARKLGFLTPDFTGVVESNRVPQRPKKYSGLYDGPTLVGPDGKPVTLYRHTFGKPLRHGINLCTYHDLSQYRGGESYRDAIVQAEAAAKQARDEYRKQMAAELERLDAMYPKNAKGKREPAGYKDAVAAEKVRLGSQYLVDHPAIRELYLAKEAYRAHIKEAIRQFAGSTQLLIFDEAHKIKNSGDGAEATSMRAELGLALVNACPRVMYVTATPADRPFDVLYLKKSGIFRDDDQFKSLMFSIGYEWKEPETNKLGEVIRDGGWRARGGNQDVATLIRANQALRDTFDLLTEEGQMLRREIAMTNLTVEMHREEAPSDALARMELIEENLTEVDDNGREKKDLMQIYGRQLEELEVYKLEKTLALIDAAITNGKQVLVYCQTVMKGDVARASTGDVKPGAIETLKGILADRYGEDAVGVLVGTSGDYEEYRRMENVRDFQAGKRRILIGTITSGGTGLNLDDTTGRNPRELIIVTPPLSFINVVQTVGRVVRANTKSRSIVHFIFFNNAVVDVWLARLIANKFASLNAIVKGEVGRLDVSSMSAASDGGESAVAAAIATESGSQQVQKKEAVRHSMFAKKNLRVEGWSFPTKVPLYVAVSGTPASTVVALGGRTPTDLKAWIDTNADVIKSLDLRMNPDELFRRYNGPYIGFKTGNRDSVGYAMRLSALLNIVAFEAAMEGVPAATPSYAVGDHVRIAQDVVWLGIAAGTIGSIVQVRSPRTDGDVWRYDVIAPGTTDIIKAVEEYKLQRIEAAAAPIPFQPGQVWLSVTEEGRYTDYAAVRIDDVTSLDILYTLVNGSNRYQQDDLWQDVATSAEAREHLFARLHNRQFASSLNVVQAMITSGKYTCVGDCEIHTMPRHDDYGDSSPSYSHVADDVVREVSSEFDSTDDAHGTASYGLHDDVERSLPARATLNALDDIRQRVRRRMAEPKGKH